MRVVKLFFPLVVLLSIAACKDDDPCTTEVPATALDEIDKTRLQADIAAIDDYLLNKGITAQSEPNGVRYVITEPGTGPTPCLESFIRFNYRGVLMKTETEFNAYTTNVRFKLNGLILGWQLVLPKLQAGTKATLYIPSGYGYGPEGGGGGTIPSNANLIFEVELVNVE